MAKKQKKPSLEDLINELVEYSEHFKDVYENGCSDPFYADGLNLNLIRNHIIYRKRMIE